MNLIRNFSTIEFIANLFLPVEILCFLLLVIPMFIVFGQSSITDTLELSYFHLGVGVIILLLFIFAIGITVFPIIIRIVSTKSAIAYIILGSIHFLVYLVITIISLNLYFDRSYVLEMNKLYEFWLIQTIFVTLLNIPAKIFVIKNDISSKKAKKLALINMQQYQWYNAQTQSFERQIKEIKSHVKCSYCDSTVPYNDGICPRCGAKLYL